MPWSQTTIANGLTKKIVPTLSNVLQQGFLSIDYHFKSSTEKHGDPGSRQVLSTSRDIFPLRKSQKHLKTSFHSLCLPLLLSGTHAPLQPKQVLLYRNFQAVAKSNVLATPLHDNKVLRRALRVNKGQNNQKKKVRRRNDQLHKISTNQSAVNKL